MIQPISLFIGYRYSQSRSGKGFVSFITFFSITGILLGVAALIIVVSVMNGFENELKTKILGLVPQVVLTQKQQQLENWSSLSKALSKQPHVKSAVPIIEAEALIQSPTGLEGTLVQGIDVASEQHNIVAKHMVQGDFAQLKTGKYQVVLGAVLAQTLNVQLGDSVRLILPNSSIFTPVGRIPMQRKFTVVGLFSLGSQVDASMIYISRQDAAKMLRRKGDGINQIRLYLDDAFAAEEVAKSLQSSALIRENQLTISTWQQSQGQLFSAVKMEKHMMWLMLSLIVAVAAFNIVSALVMVVMEKQGEIAILKTLGLAQANLLQIFVVQGMINGFWGTLIGAVMGLLLTFNLNEVLAFFGVNLLGSGYGIQYLPTDIQWSQIVIIVISALLMTFFASLYPAWQAGKTKPAEVLRNE